jgi:hypothetical protein
MPPESLPKNEFGTHFTLRRLSQVNSQLILRRKHRMDKHIGQMIRAVELSDHFSSESAINYGGIPSNFLTDLLAKLHALP